MGLLLSPIFMIAFVSTCIALRLVIKFVASNAGSGCGDEQRLPQYVSPRKCRSGIHSMGLLETEPLMMETCSDFFRTPMVNARGGGRRIVTEPMLAARTKPLAHNIEHWNVSPTKAIKSTHYKQHQSHRETKSRKYRRRSDSYAAKLQSSTAMTTLNSSSNNGSPKKTTDIRSSIHVGGYGSLSPKSRRTDSCSSTLTRCSVNHHLLDQLKSTNKKSVRFHPHVSTIWPSAELESDNISSFIAHNVDVAESSQSNCSGGGRPKLGVALGLDSNNIDQNNKLTPQRNCSIATVCPEIVYNENGCPNSYKAASFFHFPEPVDLSPSQESFNSFSENGYSEKIPATEIRA
ncbi:hypothetical protein H4219_000560 [Mycoemilia scoparia]|uniref:Uncharacterized protein n=1 Tax=Mycoemilia scoparia TaxID=417184 RepID=A0A9W8A8S9_9FUNG|nr:hypothetical protein H4219_000560 [Mycoemilia scoparia]